MKCLHIPLFYPLRPMALLTLSWSIVCMAACSLNAQNVATSAGVAEGLGTIDQMINPTTILVAHIDVPHMQMPKTVEGAFRADKDAQPLLQWLASIRAVCEPLKNDRLTMMVDLPFSSIHAPVRFLARKPATLDLAKLNEGLAAFRLSPAIIQGEYLSTTPGGNVSESNRTLVGSEVLPGNQPAFLAALDTVKGLPLQISIAPPKYLWATYEELMPRLPDKWGATPTTVLTEGVQWASIGFEPASMRLRATIQSKSPAAAERLKTELPKWMKVAAENFPVLQSALDSLKLDQASIAVNYDRIEVTLAEVREINQATGVVRQLLSALIDPLNMREKQQRLKKLTLATHDYVSTFKVLPPNKAARRADGTSFLSWRVHILPFLGEQKLYSEFRLNEAWDSEHNRKLIEKMPAIFADIPVPSFGSSLRRGHTTFLAPVGEGTVFGGNKPVELGHIKDGTSNTIFFVEVKPERAVPWTAPIDYHFLPTNPADGLAIGVDGQFLCAMGDGSVRLLSGNLPRETLIYLFKMNDGQAFKIPRQ